MTSTTGVMQQVTSNHALFLPSSHLTLEGQGDSTFTKSHKNHHAAFTLVEVLITLSVMILLVSIAFPSMTRYMDEVPLKTTAKDLRGTFFGIRRDAMTLGIPIRFRIETKSNKYIVVKTEQKSATVTELDEKFTLRETNWTGADTTFESVPQEWLSGDPKSSEHASIGWSSGVTFLPNGSCDHDYEILLITEDERHIKIFIRGLTGAMSMSDILREELDP